MVAEAERLFAGLGVRIDPRRPALGLSIADQQIIEIAKAISLDARVLIMDEPTAALSGVEVERLFTVARRLRDEGRALVFISHRFDEVFDLCDMVTVMRDGAYVDTLAVADTTIDQMVALMVGARWGAVPQDPGHRRRAGPRGARLSSAGVFHDVSFDVRAGEIVGLAGLVGAGAARSRGPSSGRRYDEGTVTLARGRPCATRPPAAIRAGMAFIPRTAASRGWSSTPRSRATSPAPCVAA